MNVVIIEISTGKLIVKYPIILGALNYTPSEQEYFNVAWQNALADSMVKPDITLYKFELEA